MTRTVLIAGGGIVGLSLAIALRTQSHLPIVVFAGPPAGADERASAVAAAARRLFARTGVWPHVAGEAEPIRGMVITDSAEGDLVRPEVLTFEGERGANAFAHMVPNEALRRAVEARAAALGIEVLPVSATFYEEDAAGVTVFLSDGESRRGAVLIAADGRRSRLREIAGIPVVTREYGQAGIVGTVAHQLPHEGRAVQHFLPNGPFAMLPLTGNRCSIVWTERPAFAAELVAMDPLIAALEIERAFGLSLGRLTVEGELQSHDLSAMLPRRLVEGRLALAGDAAHVIHPLAGQGLNLGLRDVAALAEVLTEADRLGEDLGVALPRYERWRRADTVEMAAVTDGLNALFSRRSDVLRAIRSVGLGLVDRRASLKALFMREAAGVEGELPRLMRGEAI
jgi:2-octaprenyl-6-methoxyphenol hydroxylase